MTKSQIRKLENILAMVESLQNAVADGAISARLGYGKSELLRALSMAERGVS